MFYDCIKYLIPISFKKILHRSYAAIYIIPGAKAPGLLCLFDTS